MLPALTAWCQHERLLRPLRQLRSAPHTQGRTLALRAMPGARAMRHLGFGFLVLGLGCLLLLVMLWPILLAMAVEGPSVHPSDTFWLGYFAYLAGLVVATGAWAHWRNA